MSSVTGHQAHKNLAAYGMTKAALEMLAKNLVLEVSPYHITVNAIAPGFFLTDQNRFLLQGRDGALTDRGKQILDHTPMARFGEAEDLLGTLLWLVSPGAAFVHGIVVPVDGGFSAYSGV